MKLVLPWALFDLANTFFAVAMLSFYFPLWVVEDHGAKELTFSVALAASMVCVALSMPFCGALSDATGERMRFLRWATYGCIVSTALIGLTAHLGIALLLFGIANICYQLGTVFYDALLWRVATPQAIGPVSGVGASCGYLGSAMGLLLLQPFVLAGGHQAAFVPSAGFFLLFALPSFLMIREPSEGRRVVWGDVVRSAVERLAMTLRSARALAGLWRFFWASFFALNAINTVLVFMVIYTRKVAGFTHGQVITFFLLGQVCAVIGSLVISRTIGRWGAKRTLARIWTGWMVALALLALNPAPQWLWVLGPVVGLCLGPTWATSRTLIVELSPKNQLGEMFGLAGLFGRASAVLGPLLWGLIVLDPARYRHAVVWLMALLAVGLWLLRGVQPPGTPREA